VNSTKAIDKKEALQRYKERKMIGGICAVRNTKTDKRLIFAENDLEAGRNRFEFTRKSGICASFKLQRDWHAQGAEAFVFEVMEVLEKKEDQSVEDFNAELKMLEEMIRERFDKSQLY
jgi:hypothetical protein